MTKQDVKNAWQDFKHDFVFIVSKIAMRLLLLEAVCIVIFTVLFITGVVK